MTTWSYVTGYELLYNQHLELIDHSKPKKATLGDHQVNNFLFSVVFLWIGLKGNVKLPLVILNHQPKVTKQHNPLLTRYKNINAMNA